MRIPVFDYETRLEFERWHVIDKPKLSLVNDIKLLKKLAKDGLISLHEDTGKKREWLPWSSQDLYIWYIDDVLHENPFEWYGRYFISKYVDGCFYPFLYEVK